MRIHRVRGLAALATAALAVSTLAACGDDDDKESADGKVTITVEGWRPGDEQATIDTVKEQAAAFMDDHPDIVVEPIEWSWDAATFATQLAGDTLPTSFRVPFTDTKGLAERQQILDVTEYVEALPYADEFNPSVLDGAEGHRRQDLRAAQRRLRRRPALQPHPVRAGRARPGLAADHVGRGARVRRPDRGGDRRRGLRPDEPEQHRRLDADHPHLRPRRADAVGGRHRGDWSTTTPPSRRCSSSTTCGGRTTRWASNTGYEWEPINQDFAAGKIGMYMSGSDVYNALVTTNQINPDDYGLAVLPLADSADAGILGGGSVSAVSAKASPEEAEAATLWSDYYRVKKFYDEDAAVLDAETLAAADQPIGSPTLPIFDKARWDEVQTWIEPYINVPRDQMSSFTDGVFSQQLISEPPLEDPGAVRAAGLRRPEGAHRRGRRHPRAARRCPGPGPAAARPVLTRGRAGRCFPPVPAGPTVSAHAPRRTA